MMSKLLLTAALAGMASAFAPASVGRSSSVMNEFAKGLLGSEGPEPILPLGKSENFDPLGISKKAPEWTYWMREAELKNGRVAMLACAGMVAPDFVRIPGEAYSFDSIPRVLEAHDKLPQSMIQIFIWIGFLEAVQFPALANMNNFDREPGNFGFDPLGLYPKTEEGKKRFQISELKNGRLAMIAAGGMVAGALVTGKPFPYL